MRINDTDWNNTDQQDGVSNVVRNRPGLSSDSGVSVPCERVFSSAKETDTVKRNRIHPVLMEALQTLKFSLKKEQFNFTSGWQTAPSKMKRMGNAGTTKDLLAHLLTGDRQATTDALLHALSDGDDDDDDDGNGDDGEFEDGLHNDDVEDDDDDDDDE
jgi:hypothetical protein